MSAILQQTEPQPRRWTQEEFVRLDSMGLFDGQHATWHDGEILAAPFGSPRRWTKTEFYRLAEMGLFQGQKAELLEGEIVVASPQKWAHYSTVDRVCEVLRASFGDDSWVRPQAPLDLGLVIEPEPDASVVAGSRADYTAHPTPALLIVEVSESTLQFDRTAKASLYARAGIGDYWIVNLVNKCLEVRRQPTPGPSQLHGYGYASVTTLKPGDTVAPLANPALTMATADFLA